MRRTLGAFDDGPDGRDTVPDVPEDLARRERCRPARKHDVETDRLIVARRNARVAVDRQPRHLPRPCEPRLNVRVDDDIAIQRERAAFTAEMKREAAVGAHELDVGLADEFLQVPARRHTFRRQRPRHQIGHGHTHATLGVLRGYRDAHRRAARTTSRSARGRGLRVGAGARGIRRPAEMPQVKGAVAGADREDDPDRHHERAQHHRDHQPDRALS